MQKRRDIFLCRQICEARYFHDTFNPMFVYTPYRYDQFIAMYTIFVTEEESNKKCLLREM